MEEVEADVASCVATHSHPQRKARVRKKTKGRVTVVNRELFDPTLDVVPGGGEYLSIDPVRSWVREQPGAQETRGFALASSEDMPGSTRCEVEYGRGGPDSCEALGTPCTE
eukprot:1898302-Amphidinium_carterae.1